jgi:7,8-dihydropterin-6-yl-methyl-4-(beta-D-ribofuranosyl)aminobenzene 5'-phosphate synthase
MKLTVLIDNNVFTDRYFLAEPGVSYLIQEDNTQILFDVGYSDAFIKNAMRLGADLLDTDIVVLSHGHLDHTWGLTPLIKLYTEARIEGLPQKKALLVAHPRVFATKKFDDLNEAGSLISRQKAAQHFDLQLTKEPYWVTDKIVFLGQIERVNDFENKKPIGQVATDERTIDDFLMDDTALAYKSSGGLVIITGCSHSGICNMIEQAKRICNEGRILDVIGGFHLTKPDSNQLKQTLNYFKNLKPKALHACHCVDQQSRIALFEVADLQEVGVGLSLSYE